MKHRMREQEDKSWWSNVLKWCSSSLNDAGLGWRSAPPQKSSFPGSRGTGGSLRTSSLTPVTFGTYQCNMTPDMHVSRMVPVQHVCSLFNQSKQTSEVEHKKGNLKRASELWGHRHGGIRTGFVSLPPLCNGVSTHTSTQLDVGRPAWERLRNHSQVPCFSSARWGTPPSFPDSRVREPGGTLDLLHFHMFTSALALFSIFTLSTPPSTWR